MSYIIQDPADVDRSEGERWRGGGSLLLELLDLQKLDCNNAWSFWSSQSLILLTLGVSGANNIWSFWSSKNLFLMQFGASGAPNTLYVLIRLGASGAPKAWFWSCVELLELHKFAFNSALSFWSSNSVILVTFRASGDPKLNFHNVWSFWSNKSLISMFCCSIWSTNILPSLDAKNR